MGLASLVLLVALAPSPGGRPDAGAGRDAPPPWVPRAKRIDLQEEAYYGLRRLADGYIYESETFEARVARDGVVTFQDKHGRVSSLLSPFGELPRPKGPTLESTLRDQFDKRRRRPAEPSSGPAPVPSKIDWEYLCPPSSSCDTRPLSSLIQVHGTLDLTDEIMRGLGQDPYAREKARFLSGTFEFRIKLAMAAHEEDLRQALKRLPERLEDLWADERYSLRELRRLLYELWCEMDGSSQGERGAALILDFIRRRLPCGAPSAYSDEELAAFQRLHPERRFIAPGDCRAPLAP